MRYPWLAVLALGLAGGIVGAIGAAFIVSCVLWRRFVT